MHEKIKSVIRWQNGMVMVFDHAGEQIHELQGPEAEAIPKLRAAGWSGKPEHLTWPTGPAPKVMDAGILDETTGKWMTRVAQNPQPGQYVLDDAGLYQFSAADEGHSLIVNWDVPGAMATLWGKRRAGDRFRLGEAEQ